MPNTIHLNPHELHTPNRWYLEWVESRNNQLFAAGIDPGDLDALLYPKDVKNLSPREMVAAHMARSLGIKRVSRNPRTPESCSTPEERRRNQDYQNRHRREARLARRQAERAEAMRVAREERRVRLAAEKADREFAKLSVEERAKVRREGRG